MSKDPNFTETDLFSFEAGPAKLKKLSLIHISEPTRPY